MIGNREIDRERLWASNGFDRFQPSRRRRQGHILALVVYLLALGVFFVAGLWALFD